MLYYRYIFHTDPALSETLLAWLSELPFEGFEEDPDAISGFLPGNTDRNARDADEVPLIRLFRISF